MKRLRWWDFITINIYWLGLNIAAGSITPIILPFLVAKFVPPEVKGTYLSYVRVAGLAVAMMIQPMAGLLSDRNTSRWGKRRPFIFAGTMLDLIFLTIIGLAGDYWTLFVGILLLQFSSNIAHGALQGLIPDLVPEDQRGRASGVKAIMELLPILMVIVVGPMVEKGYLWGAIGFIMLSFLITMAITVAFVREEPLKERPREPLAEPIFRLVALTAIFVGITQLSLSFVKWVGGRTGAAGAGIFIVGLAGLLAMAGSIIIGVYFAARVGLGREALLHSGFIWWVINRLLFLAAIGSVQSFAQYFLADVLKVERPATLTAILMAVVAVFLLPSAFVSGWLSDRIGRFRLVLASCFTGALGILLLLLSPNVPMVIVSGCIIGIGAGMFMATNWALGTDIVPPDKAGLFLGISNLAGAGAGIVGAGIGGPMADFFNLAQPGLGWLVIYALYGALLIIAAFTLFRVRPPAVPKPA
ncbi:MAG: MFS transporter [Anaerolineae bacterium]|nr:MFS transporter [Anaerolineae bacterium]